MMPGPKQSKLQSFFTTKRKNESQVRDDACESDDGKKRRKMKLNLNLAIALCLVTNRTENKVETVLLNVSDCPVPAVACSTSIATFNSSFPTSILATISNATNSISDSVSAIVTKTLTTKTNTTTATTAVCSVPTVNINLNIETEG